MKNRLFASMLLLISSSSIAGMDHSGLRVGAFVAEYMLIDFGARGTLADVA